jgi:hypothetical protein
LRKATAASDFSADFSGSDVSPGSKAASSVCKKYFIIPIFEILLLLLLLLFVLFY